jgi:hypothetical protein
MPKRLAPSRRAVFAPEVSSNAKLGKVSATYAAQQSCPSDCPFLNSGCFAENGFTGGFITKRLNRHLPDDITPEQIAAEEAAAIDRLTGDRDLRLHVVGDSRMLNGTRRIADAARRYIARGARRVWTYTHAWRTVPRFAWGPVSVLASCETEDEVLAARARGYATAMVVLVHDSEKLYGLGRTKLLPCPQETRGVSCADCRLCMDDRRLFAENITIAFAVHGSPASKKKAEHAVERKQVMGRRSA